MVALYVLQAPDRALRVRAQVHSAEAQQWARERARKQAAPQVVEALDFAVWAAGLSASYSALGRDSCLRVEARAAELQAQAP
jgi:hypothetical protein